MINWVQKRGCQASSKVLIDCVITTKHVVLPNQTALNKFPVLCQKKIQNVPESTKKKHKMKKTHKRLTQDVNCSESLIAPIYP